MNPHQDSTMPKPSAMQRDSEGRLVHLTIDSTTPLPVSANNEWLVAIDGSVHAQRGLTEAMRLTRKMMVMDCVLHLVNVQQWLSHEAAETKLAQRGWEASAEARALLNAAGQPWRLHVAMGDSAECIVDTVKEIGCSGIIIGSRGLSSVESLLIGSVAYKVIQQSPVSVLVVR